MASYSSTNAFGKPVLLKCVEFHKYFKSDYSVFNNNVPFTSCSNPALHLLQHTHYHMLILTVTEFFLSLSAPLTHQRTTASISIRIGTLKLSHLSSHLCHSDLICFIVKISTDFHHKPDFKRLAWR